MDELNRCLTEDSGIFMLKKCRFNNDQRFIKTQDGGFLIGDFLFMKVYDKGFGIALHVPEGKEFSSNSNHFD